MVVSPSENSGGLGAAMTVYVAREASKLWRRVNAETALELQLLFEKWQLLLAGLVFQAVWKHDFILMSWQSTSSAAVSYIIDHSLVLAFLVASQFLRIITFYSTQLPGPNYHCHEGSNMATLPPPNNLLEVLVINFPRGVNFGCGDLIFSSHMIFTLVFVRMYHKYGSSRLIKLLGWLMAVVQSLLIIASRKHYTVDVVVAWYTVNLVVFFVDTKLPEMPDRTNGISLIPVSVKEGRLKDELHKLEKDSRMRDEFHKLLNGNTTDATDRRPRVQMNGKHGEDMNHSASDGTPPAK